LICYFPERGHERDGRDSLHAPRLQSLKPEDQPTTGAIHTVFSVDGSLYQRWQADLLAFSHEKSGQPGPLTRLLSANGPPTPFAGRTFQTNPYSPHPVSGEYYPPYNKPEALRAWLREVPLEEEVVLLLDPDCLFLQPLTGSVSRGNPIAHPIEFMNPARHAELLEKHCLNPELVDNVGVPILIHKDDLAAVAPLWLEKTEEIRNDPRSLYLTDGGWIAEMCGYTLAAAEIGLRHTVRELSRFQMDYRADLPTIHYSYTSSDPAKRWVWDKRAYEPWERVPDPPDEVPLATKVLIGLLNEWVARQEHQLCLY
jgi:peptidyl serine alpha-galactosyltransferase